MKLELVPGIETDQQYMNFTYECIEFKPTYMKFQTYYEYFDQISVNKFKEQLKVQFYGPSYFRTKNDETFPQNVIIEIQKQVPTQMNLEVGK